ncbi:hypothetical protein SAMN03159496_05279 [Rhizobium sp. NFR07]|uniref:hypothetical protein n=1 Tax=Rhizobium sp. NFR07 TaxID=1566262 RepID=UPI0008ECFC0C|nr:hypothetical protein [Rhizobium sp. NFR07]SFB57277.1 hypothetical protein SAMN03159496_05279 [Rhizobium sp. NFR07]
MNQRLWWLLSALDRRAWRQSPKGTGLKTANIAVEHGLILARGDWSERRYRLTALGGEAVSLHANKQGKG